MRTLIGIVTGTKLDKHEDRIAWVWPLVEVKGSTWENVLDPKQEFPARGSIFWPKAPNIEKGNLFQFRVKDQGIRKGDGDDFMVVDHKPVFEVLDLRTLGDCEQVRKALSSGIQMPGIPPSSKLLVWCKEGFVVGPIQLGAAHGGVVALEMSHRARIPCFQFADSDICQIEYEGIARSIISKSNLGSPDSYVDWDDDRATMKRALEYAVSHSAKGSVVRPKQMIEEALESLTKNGPSADNHLELYRMTRSRSLAADVEQLTSYASEVVAALRKHPSVIAEMEQLTATERTAAKKAAEAALEHERQQLGKLQEKRITVEAALRDANRNLNETEALIREQTRDIEGKIHSRIIEVLSKAPELLADVALLKPFLGVNRTSEAPPPTAVVPWKRSANRISIAKEFKSRIIPAFKAMGVPPTNYQAIHAAIAGGLLPVVAGSRALEALRAYAYVVTGGRSLVVQASSAFADVQDIFGRVIERRFVPQAAGLIDAVRVARKSEGHLLVILDGINRGATESYLLPLINASLRRAGEISLFHPSAVEPSDPYRSESWIEWPNNLLLAATLVEGPTTLPIAPDLWNDGVLIQADLEGPSGVQTRFGDDPSEMDASCDLLNAPPSFEGSEWIREIAVGAAVVGGKFEGGMRTLGVDDQTLQIAITKCIIVPLLASIEDEEERRVRTKAVERNADSSIADWIASARRRIS